MKRKSFYIKFLIVISLTVILPGCEIPGCNRDTSPPSVSITSPLDGAVVSGPVTIKASAVDNVGVSKVEFYIDGIKVGEDTQASYEYSWDTGNLPYNSTHTIQAKAYDVAGNIGVSPSISVKIGDTQKPEVTITNPQNGDTVSGTVTIQADVVERITKNKKAPSGISKVEFYIDGIKVGEDTSSPYEYSWDTTQVSNGSHTVTVRAIDNVGNAGSVSITVEVNNLGGDTQAPEDRLMNTAGILIVFCIILLIRYKQRHMIMLGM